MCRQNRLEHIVTFNGFQQGVDKAAEFVNNYKCEGPAQAPNSFNTFGAGLFFWGDPINTSTNGFSNFGGQLKTVVFWRSSHNGGESPCNTFRAHIALDGGSL